MRQLAPLITLLSFLLGAIPAFAAEPRPQVAITMDDLDVNANETPRLDLDQRNAAILATLQRRKLEAAIFVTGMRVDNDGGRRHLQAWEDAGHLIGNHSYSHFLYPDTSFEKFSADVLRGEKIVAGYPSFETKFFRFPYLKEGGTKLQRDQMREFLKAHDYRIGYVTIDASDWAIDARLRKRLAQEPKADLRPYRDFYLEHMWARSVFYDQLSREALGRSVRHTVLIHHNLLAALFLDDLLQMYQDKGWELIGARKAFEDPVASIQPDTVPAGESLIWAIAKQSGRFESRLRSPGEDSPYEDPRMDELGL